MRRSKRRIKVDTAGWALIETAPENEFILVCWYGWSDELGCDLAVFNVAARERGGDWMCHDGMLLDESMLPTHWLPSFELPDNPDDRPIEPVDGSEVVPFPGGS